jgi:ElaB/YqjD/DUF883 family membrane-anchored ribosome-binding protein
MASFTPALCEPLQRGAGLNFAFHRSLAIAQEPIRIGRIIWPTRPRFPLPSCSAGINGRSWLRPAAPVAFQDCDAPKQQRNPFEIRALESRLAASVAALNMKDARGTIMARKRTSSDDIVEIEREISLLMRDLESRIGRLNTLTRNGAAHAASEASDYVSETVENATEALRNGAHALSGEAARYGNDALRRVEEEVEQRPLLTLAIAAGIGFLAGMAGRRH